MKTVTIELAGQECHLFFSVDALFSVQTEHGSAAGLLEAIQKTDEDGILTVCKTAALLASQGELARRALGYEPRPFAEQDAIYAALTPAQLPKLKAAILGAVSLGFGREIVSEAEEIDLGLAELEAQKKTT